MPDGTVGYDSNSVKSIIKLLFVGFTWAALLVYCDEFQHKELWDKKPMMGGLIAIFALIIILTLIGQIAAFLENFPLICFFLFGYTATYVANAITYHTQKKEDIVPLVMGGISWMLAFGLMLAVCGAGGPLGFCGGCGGCCACCKCGGGGAGAK